MQLVGISTLSGSSSRLAPWLAVAFAALLAGTGPQAGATQRPEPDSAAHAAIARGTPQEIARCGAFCGRVDDLEDRIRELKAKRPASESRREEIRRRIQRKRVQLNEAREKAKKWCERAEQ
jgi:hypothetical protein